ncbi:MAG: pyridoxal phosphate-dependent aminotransferase [bacterium]
MPNSAKTYSLRLMDEWGSAEPSALAFVISERHARGLPLTDLITANPQLHDFEFEPELLRDALARAALAARHYEPDPLGQTRARESVAAYHGGSISPGRIVITPGTSMSYWYAFRLLANPGDNILCPSPTYPLFDDIARLAHVNVRRYHMRRDAGRWAIDPDEIAFQCMPRTRAIVMVSPHNPTGSIAGSDELAAVARIARERGIAFIFDEVFREFAHGGAVVPRPAQFGAPLAVTLNGFSKMFSLPGLKAGWMAVEGEPDLCGRFIEAAACMSDTFLPVSEITQTAMPAIIALGGVETRRFSALCSGRMTDLVQQWNRHGIQTVMPEGGPCMCVPFQEARIESDEEAVIALVREHGILAHPGSFYGLPSPHIVMTCIHRPPWPIDILAEVLK